MATRKPLIAGNWKMNLNHLEAIALVQKIAFTLPDKYLAHVEVAVLPPFTALRSVQTLIDADKIGLAYGAQDLSAQDSGAYTGEISGSMLAKLGDEIVELKQWDAVRVPKETMRSFEGGPDGVEVIAIGAPNTGPGDAVVEQNWWTD